MKQETKRIVQKKPLFLKLQEKFEKEVEQPELERQKKKLQEIRNMH